MDDLCPLLTAVPGDTGHPGMQDTGIQGIEVCISISCYVVVLVFVFSSRPHVTPEGWALCRHVGQTCEEVRFTLVKGFCTGLAFYSVDPGLCFHSSIQRWIIELRFSLESLGSDPDTKLYMKTTTESPVEGAN